MATAPGVASRIALTEEGVRSRDRLDAAPRYRHGPWTRRVSPSTAKGTEQVWSGSDLDAVLMLGVPGGPHRGHACPYGSASERKREVWELAGKPAVGGAGKGAGPSRSQPCPRPGLPSSAADVRRLASDSTRAELVWFHVTGFVQTCQGSRGRLVHMDSGARRQGLGWPPPCPAA